MADILSNWKSNELINSYVYGRFSSTAASSRHVTFSAVSMFACPMVVWCVEELQLCVQVAAQNCRKRKIGQIDELQVRTDSTDSTDR